MKKHLILRALFLIATLGLLLSSGGCTSKKADDSQVAVENADVEKIEAEGLDALTNPQASDPALDAALNNDTATTLAPTIDTPPPQEVAATNIGSAQETLPPGVEPSSPATDLILDAPADAQEAESAALAPTMPDIAATIESTPAPPTEAAPATEKIAAPKPTGALKKISDFKPYQLKDGGWVNTVYVARPKETLKKISEKIYGSDKTKELKKIAENSYLKSRAVKAGDKIYYSSPNRPDDSMKAMFYYEDTGAVPETYVAKKGESLKKISNEMLGYGDAWKEVWTSNPVESKTALKDGETLRYWKSTDVAMAGGATDAPAPTGGANLIDSSQAPEAMSAAMGQAPPTGSESFPPPPPEAAASLPPPPPEGTADLAPPPPPPPEGTADLAPPPPPPPGDSELAAAAPMKKKVNLDEAAEEEEEEGEMLDSDTMTSLGVLGVLVALLAFIIIRKKKQKAAQMAESQMTM